MRNILLTIRKNGFWRLVLRYLILIVLAVIILFPIGIAVLNALKSPHEYLVFPQTLFPKSPTFNSFLRLGNVYNGYPFTFYLANSLLIALLTTALETIIALSAGYILARRNNRLIRLTNIAIELSLVLGGSMLLCMKSGIITLFGLFDSYWGMILPFIGTGFSAFLIRQFVRSLPEGLFMAAKLDGAGVLSECFRITAPNIKPAISAVAALTFIFSWQRPVTLFQHSLSTKTLVSFLESIDLSSPENVGIAAAAALFLLVPVVVIFIANEEKVCGALACGELRE